MDSTLKGNDAELLYLTNNGDGSFTEHILDSGDQACDTFFRVIDLDGDGYLEVLIKQFFCV